MTEKIKAVKFELGPGEGCGYQAYELNSWQAIGKQVRELAFNAPKTGGYDKTDFSITFEDGEVYTGRLDIKHPTCQDNDNDVAKHVFEHLQFYSGSLTPEDVPPHLTYEQYTDLIEASEDTQGTLEFLNAYDIPQTDQVDDPIIYRQCLKCGDEVKVLKTEQNGSAVCRSCQELADLKAKGDARRAKLEADPLYHVGWKEVTGTIKKLLKERSGKTWSVTRSRGSSFITIQAPPSRRDGKYGYTSPEDARELASLLGLRHPYHHQGYSSDDRYELLCLARGDDSEKINWEELYNPHTEHFCHVVNSCLDSPKTEEELFESYENENYSAFTSAGLNHLLYILVKRGELFETGDGRYTSTKPDQGNGGQEQPQPDLDPEPAPETPEDTPPASPASQGNYTLEVQGTWTWVKLQGKPVTVQEVAFKDGLKALGFRWSKKRVKWYARDLVTAESVQAVYEKSFENAENLNVQETAPAPAAAKPAPKPKAPKKVKLQPGQVPDLKKAERLRKLAEGLDVHIEKKRNCFAGANLTRRRQGFIDAANKEADKLENVQVVLRALADQWEAGTVPGHLVKVTTKKVVNDLVQDGKDKERYGKFYNEDSNGRYFPKAGQYAKAVEWVKDAVNGVDNSDRDTQRVIERLEKEAFFNRPPDFFCTPKAVYDLMFDHIRLEAGDRVLEPEAGTGVLADGIKNEWPGVEIDCVEIIPSLVKILELKGYKVVGSDFLEYETAGYDAIIMNPPFSKQADIDHVLHAYSLLGEGGTLVSVMSPGPFFNGNKKAKAFREWFNDEVGGEKYDLPEGSFKESGTGVNSIYVVIGK